MKGYWILTWPQDGMGLSKRWYDLAEAIEYAKFMGRKTKLEYHSNALPQPHHLNLS